MWLKPFSSYRVNSVLETDGQTDRRTDIVWRQTDRRTDVTDDNTYGLMGRGVKTKWKQ